MMTIIKLGLHNYIHNVSCDYPGCLNAQSFDGKWVEFIDTFDVVPAEIESELIRLGWIMIEPESVNSALLFCPSHKAYLERISDDDRKKVVDAITKERKKYITSIIRSLQSYDGLDQFRIKETHPQRNNG